MLCEYDLFGIEVSFYQKRNPDFDMPSDAERINRIMHLVQEGYGDQVVIGHDVHTKHRLVSKLLQNVECYMQNTSIVMLLILKKSRSLLAPCYVFKKPVLFVIVEVVWCKVKNVETTCEKLGQYSDGH